MMKSMFKKSVATLIVATLFVGGCARNMGGDTYTSGSAVGKAVEGVIVSARQITIKDNDKLQDNTVGMLSGGVLAGIAGSSVGKGTGQGLATAGAAILGGLAGAFVQDKLTTQQGMEYVVRLDSQYIDNSVDHVNRKEISFDSTGDSIEKDIKKSMSVTKTKSNHISVIQSGTPDYNTGQHVLIIYHDDRPRITSVLN